MRNLPKPCFLRRRPTLDKKPPGANQPWWSILSGERQYPGWTRRGIWLVQRAGSVGNRPMRLASWGLGASFGFIHQNSTRDFFVCDTSTACRASRSGGNTGLFSLGFGWGAAGSRHLFLGRTGPDVKPDRLPDLGGRYWRSFGWSPSYLTSSVSCVSDRDWLQ